MPNYIEVPVETSPDQLALDGFDLLKQRVPGWVPHDGNLETILIEAQALNAATVRDLASRVPTSIFRYFGRSILGVNPQEATRASVTATFTMINSDGYTIPGGTQVGIVAAGDQIIAFNVLQDYIVSPGATSRADIVLIAAEPGEDGSGLGAASDECVLLDTIDFIDTITQNDQTTGGVDAEADEDYLNRLVQYLTLLSPRAILPRDYEVLAVQIAGVERALAIDNYNPATNELQEIVINATGGTWTATYSGQTTAAINHNATAADLQTALENLSNIAVGDVDVTGGPGASAPFVIEFTGTLAGTNVAAITTNAGSLSGGASTATVTTTRNGSVATGQERYISVAIVDAEGAVVSTPVKAAVDAYLQEEREINFHVEVIDPTITEVDVEFTVKKHHDFTDADVEARTEQAVADYLSKATWGYTTDVGDATTPNKWENRTVVRINELISLLDQVQGVDYVVSVEICEAGGTPAASDLNLTGVAPLADAGDITGTIT